MIIKFSDLFIGQIVKINGEYAYKENYNTLFVPNNKETPHIRIEPEKELEIEDDDNT